MLSFRDSPVGGTVLIIESIQSPDYVSSSGTTGWRIARDGSVVFNNGTFRGAVDIGNATYRVIIGGPSFGRVQFLNGAGTIEHGAFYDSSTAAQYSVILAARNANTVAADPPGAYIIATGDNDTVSAGPTLSLATFNPEGRPGESITLTSPAVFVVASSGAVIQAGLLTINGPTNINGATTITGAATVNGNATVNGAATATGTVTAPEVWGDKANSSGAWSDGNIVASSSGSVANLVMRTAPYAVQIRLGTGSNTLFFRDTFDANYVALNASAFNVSSREATKSMGDPLAGAVERILMLDARHYRRRIEHPDVELRLAGLDTDDPAAADAIAESAVNTLGFTVENVAAAIPEAVVLGADGEPEAYDLAAVVATLVAAVQQLARSAA